MLQHASTKAVLSLEDAIAVCHQCQSHSRLALKQSQRGLPIDGFGLDHLIGLFDDLLALLAHWLKGNSLAQTLFTCLYLHKPSLIADPALKV